MANCAKGIQNAHFSKGQKLTTRLTATKSTGSRRHHYTTLTAASTSLRRQGEHNPTESLPPTNPNPYTRYLVAMPNRSRALLTLLRKCKRTQHRWARVACQGRLHAFP